MYKDFGWGGWMHSFAEWKTDLSGIAGGIILGGIFFTMAVTAAGNTGDCGIEVICGRGGYGNVFELQKLCEDDGRRLIVDNPGIRGQMLRAKKQVYGPGPGERHEQGGVIFNDLSVKRGEPGRADRYYQSVVFGARAEFHCHAEVVGPTDNDYRAAVMNSNVYGLKHYLVDNEGIAQYVTTESGRGYYTYWWRWNERERREIGHEEVYGR